MKRERPRLAGRKSSPAAAPYAVCLLDELAVDQPAVAPGRLGQVFGREPAGHPA
jgi:hypothetical protein